MGLIDLVFGDRNDRKRALLEQARARLREGRVEKAVVAAERALRLDPDGSDAREVLGQIQLRLGQLALADLDIEAAIQLLVQAARLLADPVVLFYRGLAFREAKQHLKAIEDFSKVMRSEEARAVPYASYATFCRGLCYLEMGEHKHAIKDFTTCLEADPESPIRHRFLAHRALARSARGDKAEALADLRAAEVLAARSTEVALARATLAFTVPPASLALPAPSEPSRPPQPERRPPVRDELLELQEIAWDDVVAEEPAAPPAPDEEPRPADRLAALKARRDAAFAERGLLFGGSAARPPPQAPAPEVEIHPAPPPLSNRGERCMRKAEDLLARFEAEPRLFEDLELCVDYLLVIARLRELSASDRRAIASRLRDGTLERLESAERTSHARLVAQPGSEEALDLAEEVSRLLEVAPPPTRLRGTTFERLIRDQVARFEALGRAQKFLFLEACGGEAFARFGDYLIVLGAPEVHP